MTARTPTDCGLLMEIGGYQKTVSGASINTEECVSLIQLGSDEPRRWPLLGSSLTVGRYPTCEVRVEDPGVSRSHARLFEADNEWWIADLRSANGTLVNDKKVTGGKVLRDGDVIQVGDTRLQILYPRKSKKS
ncbi:MAG: FHA domain-containing protein [Actinomycetota bacterium]